MEDIVIVDNKSYNYCEQLYNGIPITEFEGDRADDALFHLKDYLIDRILPSQDVRKII